MSRDRPNEKSTSTGEQPGGRLLWVTLVYDAFKHRRGETTHLIGPRRLNVAT
ncbi:MAG: hypothetical protein IPK13_03135 [Deltaproteobacteria bacterium]|nr:hypothetical protein [Deltaproteobacteria bacterium]